MDAAPNRVRTARIHKDNPLRKKSKAPKLPRRPTILSPAGHIRSYNSLRFAILILTGCSLSFIGGYVNTICIDNFYQTSISAFTGTTSKMAVQLVRGDFIMAIHFFLLVVSFVLGSFISAALVGGSSFRIDRSYGLVLLLESSALALGYLFEKTVLKLTGYPSFSLHVGAYWMSLACGLQNGMCTTFSGAVIRTTHVTGTLTDIGLIVGQAIFHPRTRKHLWKLKVLLPLYAAFCLGGCTGYLLYKVLLTKAILVPSGIVGVSGIAHICYCKTVLMYKTKRMSWRPWKRDDAKEVTAPTINQADWYLHDDFEKQVETPMTPLTDDSVSLTIVSVHGGRSNVSVL